ncbi:F0F1 ATP synthase subunit epsilon [Halomonas organivorans]|uniref:ATP synthase epsilon chain n=1 Tax=Halomonas organivorans TaxID=257772 RepID=A0A7W5G3M5_9GAMM|nr:F0F1 ATP synthase subunit epsilon [Halomonas organivorans]MBB3139234.1 F-type H+-transporting ATPase subunit epsilon [Halomonas organivorans]
MASALAPDGSMRLQVLLPTEVLVDEPARRVLAVAEDGAFCLLPRHLDFVAALVPGVLLFHDAADRERCLAVDRGLLVKCGQTVRVSTPNGVRGEDLGALQALVEARFLALDDQARRTRSTLARLEAGTLRRFRQLQESRHG